MEKIRKFLSTWYGVATVTAIVMIILNFKLFSFYLLSPVPQGWDGAAHFASTLEYSKHIFPTAWGWLTNWSAGMPFPQFYPPLFAISVSFLYKIFFFVNPLIVFNAFAITLQLLLIYVLSYATYQHTKRPASLYVSATVGLLIICAFSTQVTNSGITLGSTLNTAMISQLISGIFFVLFYVYLDRAILNSKYIPQASIFFACIVLSNAHFVIPASIYFFLSFFYSFFTKNNKKEIFKRTFFIGLFAVLIASFWALPLIQYYKYLNTYPTFIQITSRDLMSFTAFPFFMGFGLVVGILRKDNFLIRAIIFLFIIGQSFGLISILGRFGVVAHLQRWVGVFYLIIPLIAGVSFDRLGYYVKSRVLNYFIVVCFVIICVLSASSWSFDNKLGFYLDYKDDKVQEVSEYLKNNSRKGFVDIEYSQKEDQPSTFTFTGLYGLSTPMDVTNLRESSPSSQFLTAVRNSFSLSPEAWGMKTYLAFNNKFTQQPISKSLDRAERSGIQSFLVRSMYARKRLLSDTRIALEKDFGKWSLYSFKQETPRAYIPEFKPIAFYGPVSFKYRSIADYDWGKLQEVILFYDIPYVTFYPNDQYLDKSTDFDRSGSLFISSYMYHNKESALNKILDYANHKDVILVSSDNPLFLDLKKAFTLNKKLHIQILEKAPAVSSDDELYRLQVTQDKDTVLHQIGEALSNIEMIKNESDINVTNTTITNKKIDIILNKTPDQEIPILITSSYFPAWKGDSIPYMASPTYTLVFTDKDKVDLSFKTPISVWVGWVITLLAITLLAFWNKIRF